MPICCEPGERYAVVLAGDKGKTPEPTIWCRHLTARQFAMTLAAGRVVSEELDPEKRVDVLTTVLDLSVVGWSEIPEPYAPGRVLDLLTLAEAWELWDRIIAANRLGGDDAKKSDSPSPSDTESSAAAGSPGAAETAPVVSNH